MSNTIDSELQVLHTEWRKRIKEHFGDNAKFTWDGVVYKNGELNDKTLESWIGTHRRVLFLLKDQNQPGTEKWDEDIRYWLKNIDKDDACHKNQKADNRNLKSPFICKLAFILWGLSKIDKNNAWWPKQVEMHFEEVKAFFNTQPFALLECKKVPGGGRVDDKMIKQHLTDYGDLLKREIDILKPNMIVCTSNLIHHFILQTYPQNELISMDGHDGLHFHPKTGTFIFSSWHPSARKSCEDIYEGIMYHYRLFLDQKVGDIINKLCY